MIKTTPCNTKQSTIFRSAYNPVHQTSYSTLNRAFTLIELLVVIAIVAILISILLPAIFGARNSALIATSMSNLRNHGAAHAIYAAEWNGRQVTMCPDDLTVILREETGGGYVQDYAGVEGVQPVSLGFTRNGEHITTTKGYAIQPSYWITQRCWVGTHMYYNSQPFNQYMNGRVYDPVFYAPKDYFWLDLVEHLLDDPGEWPEDSGFWFPPAYQMSLAAMLSPDVFRGPSRGGSQYPPTLAGGHRSPNLSNATYPDLKTHMLENHWLQNPPSVRIPGFPLDPWLFNSGPGSSPATLFYDGHVRLMSVREAVASSRQVESQGEDPLVVNSPSCLPNWFHYIAYNGMRNEISSYHVFTRDGIKGRDTTHH